MRRPFARGSDTISRCLPKRHSERLAKSGHITNILENDTVNIACVVSDGYGYVANPGITVRPSIDAGYRFVAGACIQQVSGVRVRMPRAPTIYDEAYASLALGHVTPVPSQATVGA
eukprot:1668109-Pleurochrysis_carterae.AAC.2